MTDYAQRAKVFKFLDDQNLLSILNNFDNMPDELSDTLFESHPDYTTYDNYKQATLHKHFESFDDFVNDIFSYLRVIPDLFPEDVPNEEEDAEEEAPNNKLPNYITVYKYAIEEVLLNLHRYVNLLSLNKNTLKARYFRFITNQFDQLMTDRPNTTETDAISKPRSKVFSSHSIPTKINPP